MQSGDFDSQSDSRSFCRSGVLTHSGWMVDPGLPSAEVLRPNRTSVALSSFLPHCSTMLVMKSG